MPEAVELLREGRFQELWARCCGFLDLTMEQTMAVQRRLLMEQIGLLADCELGRHFMRDGVPRSPEEFREIVPLTTYAAYAPYFQELREDVLPEKPIYWQRTSGRSAVFRCKWAPVTERMRREQADLFLALLFIASCDSRGQIGYEVHDKILFGAAPPPLPVGILVSQSGI